MLLMPQNKTCQIAEKELPSFVGEAYIYLHARRNKAEHFVFGWKASRWCVDGFELTWSRSDLKIPVSTIWPRLAFVELIYEAFTNFGVLTCPCLARLHMKVWL